MPCPCHLFFRGVLLFTKSSPIQGYEAAKTKLEYLGSGQNPFDDLGHLVKLVRNGDWANRFPSDSAIVKYCQNAEETAQITSGDLQKAFGMEPHIAQLFSMLVARTSRFNETKFYFVRDRAFQPSVQHYPTLGHCTLTLHATPHHTSVDRNCGRARARR